MRLDVLTIFPEYLAPLDLSLIGKARRDGVLDVRVIDLRTFTHDRHRTVDDTPYGGGAGMVMTPEPWAEAFDAVLAPPPGPGRASVDAGPSGPLLVVPGPGGTPFTQATARRLAEEDHVVFACGRYEGIDERVYDHAREAFCGRVEVISLGDYVLNGGEVAALAMIEAIARLVPGVVGNAASLVEESHEDGLLEYPVYTKPASWRGRDVPAVLLSGDHARIAAWRHEQRLERTAARRPDLLAASEVGEVTVRAATPADAAELHVLTRCCWVEEARANGSLDIPPLVESLEELRTCMHDRRTWVGVADGRIVASVRAREVGRDDGGTDWEIGRLMVAPDRRGTGLGRGLLAFAEAAAPAGADAFRLVTGAGSARNQRLYRKAGYRVVSTAGGPEGMVTLRKPRR
ncbi:tRNA (guanosine(37)-N1)-methyltransferase TrmD [Agilicoccus flavus]|uniref:tRNA (guanosine(37)-N1)-methyltransferase TrmD n=1 Tax=Agilicoccus flavus TaxID=2775968 RepID=UPI001CF6AB6E|nr:tRNA (guanosine(37)-N1)-methyltransferase TrmD [Agilicoccus flavus]